MLSKNKIKYIQTLYQKKQREKEHLFIAEGDKITLSILLQKPEIIQTIYATQFWINKHNNSLNNINVETISANELQQISSLQTPNDVLCVAKIDSVAPKESPLQQWVLMLDNIQDPGNLGTIIRLADWFGIKEIICSQNTADCYNAKVIQSTMGSFTQVNICYLDIVSYLQKNKKATIYAAALNGIDITKITTSKQAGIIVIGNEGNGISDVVLQYCSTKITIKGKGKADSLNAAIATGIILSHLVH